MTSVPQAQILEELQRVAALPQGNPLSASFYQAHRGDGSLSRARLIQRFGSWSEACAAAGVSCHGAPRAYRRAWSEEELVAWVRRFLAEASGSTSYATFTAWLQEHQHEGAPSAQTVRNRMGSWKDAVTAAG